jgi:hypothetical protein
MAGSSGPWEVLTVRLPFCRLQAEMYTPMSFNAFPFDTQYLSVQLQYGNKYPESPINIVPSGELVPRSK